MPDNHVTEGQFVEYIQEAATQMNKIDDKINQVEKITAFNQKGNVATYADLATIENPQVNDAYGVIADGLTYVYNGTSFPTEGNGMDLRIKPDGVVAEGNTQAVSGGEVYKTYEVLNTFIKKAPYDLSNEYGVYNRDGLNVVQGKLITKTGVEIDSLSYNLTGLIPIIQDYDVDLNLYNGISSICFYDENKNFVSGFDVNDLNALGLMDGGLLKTNLFNLEPDASSFLFSFFGLDNSAVNHIYTREDIIDYNTISHIDFNSDKPLNSESLKPIDESIKILQENVIELEKEIDSLTDAKNAFYIDQSIIIKTNGSGYLQPNNTITITNRDSDYLFTVNPSSLTPFDNNWFTGVVFDGNEYLFISMQVQNKATGKLKTFDKLPTNVVSFQVSQGDSQHLSRFGYKALAESLANSITKYSYRKKPYFTIYAQECDFYERDFKISGNTIITVTRLPNTATGGWIIENELVATCEMGPFASDKLSGRKFKNSYNLRQQGINRGFKFNLSSGVDGFLRIILGADLTYNNGVLNVEIKDQDGNILYNENATKGGNQEILVNLNRSVENLDITLKTVDNEITTYQISSIEIFKTYSTNTTPILQKNGLNIGFLCDSWGEFPLLEGSEVGFTRPNSSVADGLGYLAFHLQDYLSDKNINVNVFNASKGGQTSAWGNYWVNDLIINLPQKMDYCVINFAINDSNSVSYSIDNVDSVFDFDPTEPYLNKVISEGGLKGSVTHEQWLSNMYSICEKLINSGIKPIILMNPLLAPINFGLLEQHLIMLKSNY